MNTFMGKSIKLPHLKNKSVGKIQKFGTLKSKRFTHLRPTIVTL